MKVSSDRWVEHVFGKISDIWLGFSPKYPALRYSVVSAAHIGEVGGKYPHIRLDKYPYREVHLLQWRGL